MNIEQHFRRLVFWQVLIGIALFGMAEQNPSIMLAAASLAALSWYVTEGPAGKTLPTWVLNVAALVAIGGLVFELRVLRSPLLSAMGHFTIGLQVLMLYAPKRNVDYIALMLLSLLHVMGASVMSVSILVAMLLVLYVVMLLRTLLAFQFKLTADRVYKAHRRGRRPGVAIPRPPVIAGQGRARHGLYALLGIALVCVLFAAALFVSLPRGQDARASELMHPQTNAVTTGFAQQVNLNQPPPVGGSLEPVLNLTVLDRGETVGAEGEHFLLRGAVLDQYDPALQRWTRSPAAESLDRPLNHARDTAEAKPTTQAEFEGRIVLRRGGRRTLFTVQPMTMFTSSQVDHLTYNTLDGSLRSVQPMSGAVIYSLRWPMNPVVGHPTTSWDPLDTTQQRLSTDDAQTSSARTDHGFQEPVELSGPVQNALINNYAQGWHDPTGRITALAQDILRPLNLSEIPDDHHLPSPGENLRAAREARRTALITLALAEHLRRNYSYSLETRPVDPSADPVLDFLENSRRGHCEIFATTLAALCRTQGLRARVITGYLANEYNPIGGYYVIRQRHAHAWCEVYLGPRRGWLVVDPTPPAQVNAITQTPRTWLTQVREVFEHIEYTWINLFVAFDDQSRRDLVRVLKASLQKSTQDRGHPIGFVVTGVPRLLAWGRSLFDFERLPLLLGSFIVVCLTIATGSLINQILTRRRELTALGLDQLPKAQRRRLARDLGFFITMSHMLERHGHRRPSWQSPKAFATRLSEDHPMRFDPAVALTEHFYGIRFGGTVPDTDMRQRIKTHLRRLEYSLNTPQVRV